jgi:hypothetical protein
MVCVEIASTSEVHKSLVILYGKSKVNEGPILLNE